MGAIWWETRGTCPPTFWDGGDITCHVRPHFSLRVCSWRGFTSKCDVCHVLCEEFFMLDVTHSHVDVETEFGVGSLILIFFISIFTSKLIFSILQVCRDCKRLLTASVRHISSVIYCKKGHCLETVKFNGCTLERPQCSRDVFHEKTLANWLYCYIGCHIFRNK